METEKVKASITQAKDSTLTLRLWLTEEQKQLFLLETGKLVNSIMKNIVIM